MTPQWMVKNFFGSVEVSQRSWERKKATEENIVLTFNEFVTHSHRQLFTDDTIVQ
jgi:hypothetical protein